jgi:hypothetical protein
LRVGTVAEDGERENCNMQMEKRFKGLALRQKKCRDLPTWRPDCHGSADAFSLCGFAVKQLLHR